MCSESNAVSVVAMYVQVRVKRMQEEEGGDDDEDGADDGEEKIITSHSPTFWSGKKAILL